MIFAASTDAVTSGEWAIIVLLAVIIVLMLVGRR